MNQFEDYVRDAWTHHACHPHAVLERLEIGFELLCQLDDIAGRLADFSVVVEHTALAHCGQWAPVDHWLTRLRALGRPDGRPLESTKGIGRLAFALTIAQVGHADPPPLPDDQVLPACANGLAAHCHAHGPAAALAWIHRFSQGLPTATRSHIKAVAGAMNGLSFHLSRLSDGPGAQEVSIAAATLSRDARALLGHWRALADAERFLSLTLAELDHGEPAQASARRCQALCSQNAAPVMDRFLAAHAMARASCCLGDATSAQQARAEMACLLAEIDDTAARAQLAALLLSVDVRMQQQADFDGASDSHAPTGANDPPMPRPLKEDA
ncbi:hypothetical protein [Ideonella sp.]|uniref:hypothetical protein n=1 Tax=Ideonella sp. TaxID=1929293 RepID=UPI0035AEBE1E